MSKISLWILSVPPLIILFSFLHIVILGISVALSSPKDETLFWLMILPVSLFTNPSVLIGFVKIWFIPAVVVTYLLQLTATKKNKLKYRKLDER